MPYSKMKFAVGIFVITLFLAIGTFLFLLLQEKGTFDKRYSYHFSTESANSFSIGMPLKLSGFKVGVIDSMSLSDDGSVKMTFSVSEQNRKWISKDSYLLLKKPLIGSAHIEIHSTIGNEPLPSSSVLEIKMSDDINDMISKLEPAVENIINIISGIDKIVAVISKDDSDIMQTLANLNKFSAQLAEHDSLLSTITGDDNATNSLIKSLNKTTPIMQEIHKISQDVSNITNALDSEIMQPASASVKELELIMKDVKIKLDVLNGTINSLGSYDKDLINLKEQISVGLDKSNQIMDKVDSLMQDEESSEVVLP